MTDEEESGNVAPSTSVGSGTSAGAQAGWDSSVDIGSPAGPEPSLRTIIQHYYESHGIRQAKARSLTLQYIAAAPPAPSAWLPIESAPKDGSFLAWPCWGNKISSVTARSTGYPSISGQRFEDKPTHWMPLPPPPEKTA